LQENLIDVNIGPSINAENGGAHKDHHDHEHDHHHEGEHNHKQNGEKKKTNINV